MANELICPRCDKRLGPEHDEKACDRKKSRRFFLQMLLGGAVAAVTPAPKNPVAGMFSRDLAKSYREAMMSMPPVGNYIISTTMWPTQAMADLLWRKSPLFERLSKQPLSVDGGKSITSAFKYDNEPYNGFD